MNISSCVRVKSCDRPAMWDTWCANHCIKPEPSKEELLFTYGVRLCAVSEVPVYRPLTSRARGPAQHSTVCCVVLTPTSKIMVNFCTDYFESLTSDKKGGRESVGPVDPRLLQKRLSPHPSLLNALQNPIVWLFCPKTKKPLNETCPPPHTHSSHLNSVLPLLVIIVSATYLPQPCST